ncbi:uncharacterized protein LOC6581185 isoform X3 [Drosophila mojavensis]|nr:uncharacterized protein LOC6581185 isoform X3 [Drosophila mojavensis]
MTITLPSIYFELSIHIVNEAVLHRKIIEHYNIPQVFDETNGLLIPNLDSYFYKHIGHHISKINDNIERETLFRKVYLDFRFLDQKIRNDCTPLGARGYVLPTLQVLRLYEAQIINEKQYMCAHQSSDYKDNDNVYYDLLLNALITFLLNAEEKLIRSEFSCLLQIALMTEVGVVYDEAFRQAQRLPSYVWFTECGQSNPHRQIINLGKHQVRHAIYLDDDYCLMALSNQQLLLTDVSLDGDVSYLLSDNNDLYDIVEMCVFNKHKHLLTLYSNGSLKLWSLQHLLRRRNTDSSVRPRLGQVAKHSKIFCNVKFVNNDVQRLTNTSADQKICSFFLEEKDDEDENIFIQLHVAFNNGDICICDWENKEEKFKQSHTPILKTQQRKLRCFSKLMDRFYVLCTVDCKLTVWDLRRGSKETEHDFGNEEALKMETYIDKNEDYTMLLLIFKSRVWQLRFKHSDNNSTIVKKPLHFTDMDAVSITCGKLSKDGRYLVLGTVQGLIVYDLKVFDSVLRSNISEHIICLDIYDLNSPKLKYIVLCGAAGKSILHLYTLRNIPANENQSITWAHKAKRESYSNNTTVDLQSYLEPNVYLRPLLIKCNNDTLLAVDSRSRIHKIQIEDGESHWSMITTPLMDRNSHITALCTCKNNNIFAGYSNGVIFNISKNEKLLQEYSTNQVDYINMINSTILITSSKTSSKYATLIFNLSKLEMNTASSSIWPIKLSKYTMSARLFNEHFLLIFTENGVISIDLYSPQQIHHFVGPYDRLVGFDMNEHRLYLAFINRTVKICEVNSTGHKLNYKSLCKENIKCQDIINELTVTHDGKLVAIGFKNGQIKIYIYDNQRLEFIFTISQGHEPCQSIKMLFSPCKQILVSCAERLCFWDVNYILSNRMTAKCRSRRYNRDLHHSQFLPKGHEEVDASPWSGVPKDLKEPLTVSNSSKSINMHLEAEQNRAYLWRGKRGHAKFPALLACITFVGNKGLSFYANVDFTQFYAIDNEGVFYHLKILEFLSEYKPKLSSTGLVRDVGLEFSSYQGVMHLPCIADGNNGIDVVGNSNLSSNCFLSEKNTQVYDPSNVI